MSDNVDSATPNTGMMVESGGTYVNTVNSDHTTFAAPVASVTIISSPVSTVESSLTDYYRQLARATGIHTLSEITSKEHHGGTYASDIYVQPDVMIVEVEDVEDVEAGRAIDRTEKESRVPLLKCLTSSDPKFQRLVLTAPSGFGKSTALNVRLQQLVNDKVPLILLRLPTLRLSAAKAEETSTSDRVLSALRRDIEAKLPDCLDHAAKLARAVMTQLDANPGVIMFDALDEVPLNDRDEVVSCVKAFLKERAHAKVPHRVLITSRPYAYDGQFAQLGFRKIELAKFTPDQQDELIKKWFVQDEKLPQIGAALTAQLQTARNGANPDQAALATLMAEPMLLTYACMLAEASPAGKAPSASAAPPLPPTRYQLFDGVVGLMLEEWDVKRSHGVAKDFKALFKKGDHQPSILRRILEQAALEELHAQAPPFTTESTGTTSTPKALSTSPLTHERLVYRVDAAMPPDLPVRAYAVVDWLAKRSGLLHATKEADGERYTLQAQLRDFLAVGGLRAKVNHEHAFIDALLPHFFGQPEWYRPMLSMALASLRGMPHALAHAVSVVLSAEQAATDEKPAHALLHFVVAWASAFGASPPWASRDAAPSAPPNPALIQLKTRCLALVTAPAKGKPPIGLRAEAAVALGLIGDPRFDPSRWHLPAKRVLSEADEPIPGFVRIAGDFMMGDKHEENNPLRKVPIKSPFYIARYATTVAQFRHFVDDGGYEEKQWWDDDGLPWLCGDYDKRVQDDDYLGWLRDRLPQERRAPFSWAQQLQSPSRPVVSVSWFEARAYVRWLDHSLHRELKDALAARHTLQLPTEPQWERAARWAANKNGYDGRRWSWGNDEARAALYANVGGALGRAASVGLYEPTGPTLFDMAGNAWEWMDNAYSTANDLRFDRASRTHIWQHAKKRENSEMLSLRGGSWYDNLGHASCSSRNGSLPVSWGSSLGFRVVLSLARNEA